MNELVLVLLVAGFSGTLLGHFMHFTRQCETVDQGILRGAVAGSLFFVPILIVDLLWHPSWHRHYEELFYLYAAWWWMLMWAAIMTRVIHRFR